MHISLDSALGRQRRLNSVGESLLQISPNASIALSLRSLTGSDPKVVRVRRDSDNDEQDFTASEVSSGALVDYVNSQVTKPLDVRELQSDGRTGDFILAKAAYSLRSLGDRQATIAQGDVPLDEDTVQAPSGKYVVQVRRSSDNRIKSFTADEVSDGTLVSFVGSGNDGFVRALYDQSVSNQAGTTPTGRHAIQNDSAKQASIVTNGALNTSGGLEFDGTDDFYNINSLSFENKPLSMFSLQDAQSSANDGTIGSTADKGIAFKRNNVRYTLTSSTIDTSVTGVSTGDLKLLTVIHNGTTNANNIRVALDGTLLTAATSSGANGSNAITQLGSLDSAEAGHFLSGTFKEFLIYDTDQTDNRGAFEANIAEHYNISGIPAEDNQVNGFVETWYDQSGNSRDITQTTADEQPKIVNQGVLLTDGIEFDGTNDTLNTSSGLTFTLSNDLSLFSVINQDVTSDQNPVISQSDGTGTGRTLLEGKDGDIRSFIGGSAQTFGTIGTTESIVTIIYDDSANTLDAFKDGSQSGSQKTSITAEAASGVLNIGENKGSSKFFDGHINEIILYLSDQTSNRSNIESNINNHYSIF